MISTAAVRTPAMTTGAAKGASTHHNFWRGVMPTPSAASRRAGATPMRPVTALRIMGRSP